MQTRHIALCALVCLIVGTAFAQVGYKVAVPTGYTPVKKSGQSTLYTVDVATDYDAPIYLLDLRGDHYAQGYDYGYLAGNLVVKVYDSFLGSMLGSGIVGAIERVLFEKAVDWQWEFLSKELVSEYQEELKGAAQGGLAAGLSRLYPLDKVLARVILLANLPGTLTDMIYVLIDEFERAYNLTPSDFMKDIKFNNAHIDSLRRMIEKRAALVGEDGFNRLCSMFAVWGPRSAGGQLLSARNLDWEKDTGISVARMITVFHPPGKNAHATFGFAGMYGALAGMSSKGLSVHEANLEENVISFAGFPWIMRLRYVMQEADNLQEGLAVWHRTNNTVGFNHMIASASDAPSTAAVAMETMAGYTAYFFDNDPREQNAVQDGERIGYPLPNAVWRTNHGYDPKIRQHYTWDYSIKSWSVRRYLFAYEAFSSYERNGILIDVPQAINITAILGDKGQVDPYHCSNTNAGSNILSVTFQPGKSKAWVSWENGTKQNWRSASCNTYIEIDLSQFW